MRGMSEDNREPPVDESNAAPRRRAPRLALLLSLAAGLVGYARLEWARLAEAGEVVAEGEFWRALDEEGKPARVPRRATFRLDDGETVEFDAPRWPLGGVELDVELHDERAFLDVEWTVDGGETRLLRVATEGTFGWLLARRTEDGRLDRPAQTRGAAQLQLFQRERIHLAFASPDGEARASLGERAAVRAADLSAPATSLRVRVRGGFVMFHGFALLGVDRRDHRPMASDDLSALADASRAGDLVAALLGVLAAFAGLAAFLVVLGGGGVDAVAAMRATAAWVAPIAAWQAAALLLSLSASAGVGEGAWEAARPFARDPFVALALLLLGFPLAAFSLRARWGRAGSAPRRAGARVLAALLAVSAAAALGVAVVRWHDRLEEPLFLAALEACRDEEPAPASLPESRRLRADDALRLEPEVRDAELTFTATIPPGAVLEARVRAPSSPHAEGVSLLLSGDESFPGGFFVDTRARFSRIGAGAPPIPTGRPIEVRVALRGDDFEATVDGRRHAAGATTMYPRGACTLLAAAGEVDVARVTLRPSPSTAPRSRTPRRLALFLAPLLGLFALVVVARLATGWSWGAITGAAGLALLPTVGAVWSASPEGAFEAAAAAAPLAATGVLLLVLPTIAGPRLRAIPYLALLVSVVAALAVLHRDLERRAFPPDDLALSQLTMLDWEGERLLPGLVHVQHPLYRRFNEYLVAHELRGRRHALEKPDGVIRVAAIGTSSTFGYLAKEPYPIRIEGLLREQGLPVEVLVAAWPGSSGTRQLAFLENVILGFRPDVLMVSLFYNDSYQLSMIDELGYARRVTDPGFERSWLGERRDRAAADRARRAFGEGGDVVRSLTASMDVPPPVAFERILREFAEIARREGLALLFVKEPTAGERPWRDEFYAVMDRVAADAGAPCADPTPTIEARGGRRLFFDIVHPTDEGHAVLAEHLLPYVRRLVRERQAR